MRHGELLGLRELISASAADGDGTLHDGRESIVEAYYTARAYRGIFPALDVQLVDNPGYNRDRGPVIVGALRLFVAI